MAINFFGDVRLSAIALTMGALVSGCGGGASGSSDAESAQASITNTSTADSSGSASTTTASTTAESSSGKVGVDISTSPATTIDPTSGSQSTGSSSTSNPDVAPVVVASATTPVSTIKNGGPATSSPTAPVSAPTQTSSTRSGAGLNLGSLGGGSPEIPSIDLMKRSSPWLTQCGWANTGCKNFAAGQSGWDTLEESKLDLDSQGWVKSLPADGDTSVKYRYVTTTVSAGAIADGLYVVKYDGQGTLGYSGGAAKVAAKSVAGRDVVQFTVAKGGFFLSVNATTSSNYLRNVRVYPPGGACANDYSTLAADASACGGSKGAFVAFESFPATKPWYPPFITDVKGFRTLRFMDWMNTNTTMIADWANRALPTDRTWAGTNGAPLETMIDLANEAGADPWVNIPPHATDDYVHQFARLAHQRLASNLKLNLEYANEAWNYGFPATNWMMTQAKATWPTQVASGANVYYLELNWYAQRLAQVCTIARQEFGADASRVTCIANTQAALSNMIEQTLACTYAAPALGKPCGKFFDVVSIAPYFGYYIGNPTYRPTIASWYNDADGGLTKLFEEINGADPQGQAMTAPLGLQTKFLAGARGMSKGWMVAAKAVADKYGLPLWAYEGGQHLLAPPGDADATFQNLIVAANRDPRMAVAYQQDLADWKAAGGQTFTYYSHVGMPSKYGLWGAKTTLADNDSPKWKALVQARDGSACWWSGC